MLVLRYTDGDEELEEVDFIDLSENEEQPSNYFRMKGGHKVRADSPEDPQLAALAGSTGGERELGAILVADLNAQQQQLNIQMLKNRSYIT
jgi:general stress protein YciG